MTQNYHEFCFALFSDIGAIVLYFTQSFIKTYKTSIIWHIFIKHFQVFNYLYNYALNGAQRDSF